MKLESGADAYICYSIACELVLDYASISVLFEIFANRNLYLENSMNYQLLLLFKLF